MSIWTIFKRDSVDRKARKDELELEFIRERNEVRLEIERRNKETQLSVKEKEAELRRAKLDYEIEEQKQKLADAMAEDDEEFSTEDSDGAMIKQFLPIIQSITNKQNTQSPTGIVSPQQKASAEPVGVSFSDEELDEIYKSLPQIYKTVAKNMSDKQIGDFIKSKYPSITDECLKRATLRVKQ